MIDPDHRKVDRMDDPWDGFNSRKKGSGLFALSLLLILIPSMFWGKGVYQVMAAADRSCRSIDTLVKSNAVSILYVADNASDGKSNWEKFDTLEEAKKAGSGGYSRSAKVYFNNSLVVRVDLELKSPSKEWVHYIRYYFRDDGTLEKSSSDFRRFGAYDQERGMEQEFLVKVLRDKYFDLMGKMVKKGSPRFFNMSTMREMKNVVYTDGPWPIYAKTLQLPFAGILKPVETPALSNHGETIR